MFSTDQEDYLIQENRKLKNKIKQLERLINFKNEQISKMLKEKERMIKEIDNLNKYINYTVNKYYINETKDD